MRLFKTILEGGRKRNGDKRVGLLAPQRGRDTPVRQKKGGILDESWQEIREALCFLVSKFEFL